MVDRSRVIFPAVQTRHSEIFTMRLTLLLWVCLLLGTSSLVAQIDSLPDSKGRDFWFCFLPNFHADNGTQGIDDADIQKRDSLFIFVAAEAPTNVHVEYRDSAGTLRSRSFHISDPTQMLSIGEQFYPYELMGFNRCWSFPVNQSMIDQEGGQNLKIAKQYFHITSDSDITVYAMDQAVMTSDAFLVLPTDALGSTYYVIAYNSDPAGAESASTPSQFAIVATEDSTVVHIDIPIPGMIFRYGNPPDTIRLNKGDVYLVQSKVGSYPYPYDLTGTKVKSNRPIAIFSGHQRAVLPSKSHNTLTSRDCLIEQLTPTSTWGHGAIVVPFTEPKDNVVNTGDVFRIIAAYDSTDVYIDSVFVKTLNEGDMYEGAIANSAHSIFATRAIEVAEYMHTCTDNRQAGRDNNLGDPFMMIIPPSNQFLNSYRFVNVQAALAVTDKIFTKTYEEQWLNVVLPRKSIHTLLLDNKSIPDSMFIAVPKSEYVYAAIAMTDGVHTVSADTGVGIYVYGYGKANSYGYVGGMAYKRYDFNPPQIFGKPDCQLFKGTSYDTALADSKLVSLKLIQDSLYNVNVSIEPFIPPSDSIHFQATLIDPLVDGYFKLEARDLEGYVTRTRFDVPGYTMRLLASPTLKLDSARVDFSAPTRTYCHDYKFINTGHFKQHIRSFQLAHADTNFSVSAATPVDVAPGDTITFTVCYRFQDFGTYSDSIMVDMGCPLRTVLSYVVNVGLDTIPPKLQAARGNCSSESDFFLTDVGPYQSGLSAAQIDDQHNCSVSVEFGEDSSIVHVSVTDWRLDAWFSFHVQDSALNSISQTDTIPGFTVMYRNLDSLSHFLRFQDTTFKNSLCDTIELYNYGLFAKTFNQLPLSQNTLFSIPQHQLPFTLNPGESKKFLVCYYPGIYPDTEDSLWRDTLNLSMDCHVRPAYFAGLVIPNQLNGVTECNIPLLSSSVPPGATFVQMVFPEPSQDMVQLVVRTDQAQSVSVRAFDGLGYSVTLFESMVPKGVYTLQVPTTGLKSGAYTLVVQGDHAVDRISHIVIH